MRVVTLGDNPSEDLDLARNPEEATEQPPTTLTADVDKPIVKWAHTFGALSGHPPLLHHSHLHPSPLRPAHLHPSPLHHSHLHHAILAANQNIPTPKIKAGLNLGRGQERPGNDAYEMPALNAAIWTSCIKSCPCPVLNKLQHPSFFHHMNHEVLFLAPDAFDFEALQVSRPSPHTFWRAQHFCISAQRISPSRNASSTWVGREFPLRSSHSRAAGVRRCYVPGVQAPPQLARVCPVRSHQLMPPHLNGISEINEISLIS